MIDCNFNRKIKQKVIIILRVNNNVINSKFTKRTIDN